MISNNSLLLLDLYNYDFLVLHNYHYNTMIAMVYRVHHPILNNLTIH